MKCDYCDKEATSIDMLCARTCKGHHDPSRAAESQRKLKVMIERMRIEHDELARH
jgi:hypothetical protein